MKHFHFPTGLLYTAIDDELFTDQSLAYFDKDGFELTDLEEHILKAHGIKVEDFKDCPLFHKTVSINVDHEIKELLPPGYYVDHACLFVRYGFEGPLRKQIAKHAASNKQFAKLLTVKPKFGVDISIDYIGNISDSDNPEVFEVLHLEHDFKSYFDMISFYKNTTATLKLLDWSESLQKIRSIEAGNIVTNSEVRDAKANALGFTYGERHHRMY